MTEERLLRAREVAERLSLHELTVRLWISTGRLRAVRIGRTVRIPESALSELLARSEYHVVREGVSA